MGRINGLFGVKGWVKVYSYTEPREAILDYGDLFINQDGSWRGIEIAEGKRHGKGIIVRLAGIEDRDQAATLLECEIAVDRTSMPPAGDGSYYWSDLEGLRIENRDGADLGRVAYLLETGANDVLVTTGKPERLIPFILETVVLNVDLEQGVIQVDWEPD